jgi:hypothetical protein
MSRPKRLLPVIVAASAVAILGVGAAAGGFVSGLVPGNSASNNQTVMAGFIDDQGDQIDIQAVSGVESFRSRGTGASVTQNTTTVYVDATTPSGLFGSGCWTVPSSPFSIRPNDNSAFLTFDSAAPGVAPCPGQLVAPGAVIQQSITPPTLQESVSGGVAFTVQWSPSGVATTMDWNTNMTCKSFRAITQGHQLWQNSYASAQITSFTVAGYDADGNHVTQSFAGSYSTYFGVVSSNGGNTTVNGPSTGTCGPFGIDNP